LLDYHLLTAQHGTIQAATTKGQHLCSMASASPKDLLVQTLADSASQVDHERVREATVRLEDWRTHSGFFSTLQVRSLTPVEDPIFGGEELFICEKSCLW